MEKDSFYVKSLFNFLSFKTSSDVFRDVRKCSGMFGFPNVTEDNGFEWCSLQVSPVEINDLIYDYSAFSRSSLR